MASISYGMFTGRNRKQFHFITNTECISHFIEPEKHAFQACRLICGQENTEDKLSGTARLMSQQA